MITFASAKYYNDILKIYRLCFYVPDWYIKNYLCYLLPHGKNIVKIINGQAVSTLTLFPCRLGSDRHSISALYVFGVATHPEFTRCGFAGELLRFAQKYAAAKNYSVLIIIPANPSLFEFYKKYGFSDVFCASKVCISRDFLQSRLISCGCHTSDNMFQSIQSVNKFCRIYQRAHFKTNILHFERDFASDIIKFAYDSDGIFSGFESKNDCAFVCAYRQEQNHVLIKDFFVPPSFQAQSLKHIINTLPAEKYTVILQPHVESLLGIQPTSEPYGLIHTVTPDAASFTQNMSKWKKSCFISPIID